MTKRCQVCDGKNAGDCLQDVFDVTGRPLWLCAACYKDFSRVRLDLATVPGASMEEAESRALDMFDGPEGNPHPVAVRSVWALQVRFDDSHRPWVAWGADFTDPIEAFKTLDRLRELIAQDEAESGRKASVRYRLVRFSVPGRVVG